MEYRIETASSASTLQSNVQHMIREGWKPVGGVSVSGSDASGWDYAQAMTKEEA